MPAFDRVTYCSSGWLAYWSECISDWSTFCIPLTNPKGRLRLSVVTQSDISLRLIRASSKKKDQVDEVDGEAASISTSHTSHQLKKKGLSSSKEKELIVDDDKESCTDESDDHCDDENFVDQENFVNVDEADDAEVEADVTISGENTQGADFRSLVEVDSEDIFGDAAKDDVQNDDIEVLQDDDIEALQDDDIEVLQAQSIQNEDEVQAVPTAVAPLDVAPHDVVLHVSSSPVLVRGDTASASGTFGTFSGSPSTKVDFHGFSVLSKHVKYLESIYQQEGIFWDTCIFQTADFISCTLDVLGRALVIADAPWSSISPEKLRLMLQFMDDAVKAGFKLDCVDTCTSRARAFLSMGANKIQLETKMKEVTEKITSLQKELELQKICEAELQKQLEAISQFSNTSSSPWSYIVG